jgi:FkbM family methyltransferase
MSIKELFDEKEYVHLRALSEFLNNEKPIIIVGAGNLGKKIASFLVSENKNLIGFADNNPKAWGTEFLNIKILAPSDFSAEERKNAAWVVAIWSPGHSFKTTRKQLESLGVSNIFHAIALLQLFAAQLLPHYHFQSPNYFKKYKKEIEEVYENLEDQESKRQYLAHLDSRININLEGLPEADSQNQYFPADVIKLSDAEIFLDAGAYDGDTLEQFFIRTDGRFSKYLALEPDPNNYEKLVNRVKKLPAGKVEIFRYAVGEENCTLRFNATGGEGAAISEEGSVVVESKRIDDLFYNYKPTYLKFDIEGAELAALKGAERTIKEYKPKLAVCLYHLPDDLWTIPLLIKQYNSGYKLYVRTHSLDGFEFVLYAIPE